uniref:Uncharacterized protein n=1 Tax=Amphimedon queenslandica TaxID=400682 RepID=A0A1X7U0R4_AMPQE
MAAALRRFCSPSLLSYRGLSTAPVLYTKGKGAEEPVKKLFLDKLAEFKSQGNVPMSGSIKKEYDDQVARLKRVYGADKNDLSKFPDLKSQ